MSDVGYTQHDKTWCQGCVNFSLLESARQAINELIKEGAKKEEFVACTGIGCHGKVHDYLELGSVYALHGRDLPTSFGIKIGNPNLKVIDFAGDGNTYNEGMEHFAHAMRYNMNMSLFVHENHLFSLTTGQATSTSWKGLKDRTAYGVLQDPFNPMAMAVLMGATFVARTYAVDIVETKRIFKEAIKHKGFAYVEVVQPCVFFLDTRDYFKRNLYKVNEAEKGDKEKALAKAREWNYEYKEMKIPYGIFYQTIKQTFEEGEPQLKELLDSKKGWWEIERKFDVKRFLE